MRLAWNAHWKALACALSLSRTLSLRALSLPPSLSFCRAHLLCALSFAPELEPPKMAALRELTQNLSTLLAFFFCLFFFISHSPPVAYVRIEAGSGKGGGQQAVASSSSTFLFSVIDDFDVRPRIFRTWLTLSFIRFLAHIISLEMTCHAHNSQAIKHVYGVGRNTHTHSHTHLAQYLLLIIYPQMFFLLKKFSISHIYLACFLAIKISWQHIEACARKRRVTIENIYKYCIYIFR